MNFSVELFCNRFYFKTTNYGGRHKLYYKNLLIWECQGKAEGWIGEGITMLVDKPGDVVQTFHIPIDFVFQQYPVNVKITLDNAGFHTLFDFGEEGLIDLNCPGRHQLLVGMIEKYFDKHFEIKMKKAA